MDFQYPIIDLYEYRTAPSSSRSSNCVLNEIWTAPFVLCLLITRHHRLYTRVGTLIVATIYLQLIQNRYMFRSFTVLHCSHQHCV